MTGDLIIAYYSLGGPLRSNTPSNDTNQHHVYNKFCNTALPQFNRTVQSLARLACPHLFTFCLTTLLFVRTSFGDSSQGRIQPVGLTVFQNLKIQKRYGTTTNWLHVGPMYRMLGQVTTK